MSGVLHPVGPEPEQTYWIRRAVVLGGALMMVILLVALIASATGTGSAASAAPPPPVAVPAGASTSAEPPAPSPSASASATASTKAETSTKTKASTKAKAKATPTPSPSAKKTTAKPAGPVACDPDELRTTLTGKERLKRKQHVALRLSLINGSGEACVVKVTPADFTLTIYSGRDRIYSTADCATAVKPLTKKVADEAAVAWSMTWNGRRSAKGCHNRPEIPRAGTYRATAKLDGAKAVTMRILIRA